MPPDLRPHQRDALQAIQTAFRTRPERGALVVMPTGSGKTLVGISVVRACLARGGRAVWLAHRTELLDQAEAAWRSMEPRAAARVGRVQGVRSEVDRDLIVASWDSLDARRRREVLTRGVQLVVVDEAHHAAAPTWRRTLSALLRTNPRPHLLGLTATPDRMDGKALPWFTEAFRYQIDDAQQAGHLVHYDHLVRSGITDYVAGAIQAVKEQGKRRQILVFAATVDECQRIARAAGGWGRKAAFVSGEMRPEDRKRIVEGFRAGRIQVLANAMVLTEGADLPCCDTVIVARRLRSRPLYLQMLGRALRPAHGKERATLITLTDQPIDVIQGAA